MRSSRRALTTCSPSRCRASSCTSRRPIRPLAGALLNLAPDHLDWHGSLEDYAAAKAARVVRRRRGRQRRRPARRTLLGTAPGEHVSFTLVSRGPASSGSAAGHSSRAPSATTTRSCLPPSTTCARPASHNVANALAAAALAGRSRRRRRGDRRRGCARSSPTRTATSWWACTAASRWVDDSKATNAHAARGSLLAYDRVVWIAGGQLKGALGRRPGRSRSRPGLRGAVLLGVDRAIVIAEALRRHAPDVPVIEVDNTRRWSHAGGRARRGRAGAPGRHRAARTRGRVLRHVRQLLRTRRGVRRRGRSAVDAADRRGRWRRRGPRRTRARAAGAPARGRRRALPRPALRLGAAAAARRRPACSASAS